MLDIKYIREHQEELKTAIKNKGITLSLDKLLETDKERVRLLRATEELREEKNKLNDEINRTKTDD